MDMSIVAMTLLLHHSPQASLSGPLPRELSSLHKLHTLSLYNNHLSGPLDSIPWEGLTRMRTLLLSSNRFQGPIPPALAGLVVVMMTMMMMVTVMMVMLLLLMMMMIMTTSHAPHRPVLAGGALAAR
jgi:hypothetical protein